MKNKHWRLHNLINPIMRNYNSPFLQVGGDGKVARMVAGHTEVVTEKKIPSEYALYEHQMGIEDFFSLVADDRKSSYGIILLSDWDNENLEERVKACYDMLMWDGTLIVEGYDRTGDKNQSWRIAGGFLKQGMPTWIVKENNLVVKKTKEIEGKLRLGVKESTFKKNPEKYLP